MKFWEIILTQNLRISIQNVIFTDLVSILNNNLHLLDIKFGDVNIKTLVVKKPNSVKFAKCAFQRPDPLVLADKTPTEAYNLLLRRWDQAKSNPFWFDISNPRQPKE